MRPPVTEKGYGAFVPWIAGIWVDQDVESGNSGQNIKDEEQSERQGGSSPLGLPEKLHGDLSRHCK
jgi:hypothetical protein